MYASTRADELAAVPWSDDEKTAFVTQQFEAQDREYRARYDASSFFVVVQDAEPVGRLYLGRLPGEVRLVDLALLPPARGRGLGGALLDWVIALAAGEGRTVSLHVERWSPVRALYERRGFVVTGESDVHLRMDRPLEAVS